MRLRPILAVVSDDLAFIAQLTSELDGDINVRVLSDIAAASPPGDGSPVDMLLVDARHISDGGHGLVRSLGRVAERSPATVCTVLSNRNCPEPLMRLI
ncbi:MAG: hypothetical protein KF861_13685, partial [Planctomycetaceae bacterium]|nr:hypothetical protein [Planctomycetaceae bacterium]